MNNKKKKALHTVLAYLCVGMISLPISSIPAGAVFLAAPSPDYEYTGQDGSIVDDFPDSDDEIASDSNIHSDSNAHRPDDSCPGKSEEDDSGDSVDSHIDIPTASSSDCTKEDIPAEEELIPPDMLDSLMELDESTVIVSSYGQLAKALSENNGYKYIYLANDITQSSTDPGIMIHNSKESIVIDGLAPDAVWPATFTQRASSALAQTIHVPGTNTVTKEITICNMNLVGKNFYGIVSTASSVYSLALNYENISYQGPQFTYNRHGSAHYSNSTISIVSAASSGGSAAQEVAEAASVSFSDSVTIN